MKEELLQMDRIKQKKKISNLLDTIEQVKTVPELANKNLTTLCLVLASESCGSMSTAEEIKSN